MPSFRTIVEVPEPSEKIDMQSGIMLLGSCFTENIGQKLEWYKFPVTINPFGVLYNPLSVYKSIHLLVEEKNFREADLVNHNNLWHSFYHHSSFSAADKGTTLKGMNEGVKQASARLKEADFLFISWGTAWVYEYKETGRVVSNCHKIPASRFNRYLINPGMITESYHQLFNTLQEFNPDINIYLTISPIRHWKDGAVDNQESKSVLHLAARELVRSLPNIGYFPSYEIVMDDLRDYRFYARDMIHLNDQAVDYIWNRFMDSMIDKQAHVVMNKIGKINQAIEHKPFQPQTEEYRSHLQNTKTKIEALIHRYPYLDFNTELEWITQKI